MSKNNTATPKAPSVEELQAQVKKLEEEKAQAEKAQAEAEAAQAEAEVETAKIKAEAEAAATAAAGAKPESGAGPDTENVDSYEVFCKIPAGMTFPMPDKRRIKLSGVPVSQLMDSSGRPLPGHGYGVTTVAADDWKYIKATWKGHPSFRPDNPVIFARPIGKGGEDQAAEQAEVSTGFEQIEVTGQNRAPGLKTEPSPKQP